MTQATLCARCNCLCGRHYVRPFAEWTRQAAEYRTRMNGDSEVLLPFTIVPLAVAKQIATITLAMSHAGSIDLGHYVALRRFVTAPARSAGLGAFRFYAYFHCGEPVFEGPFAAVSTRGGPSPFLFCDVGREPLGYMVTASDAASAQWAVRLRLCDLTNFSERPANVISVEHLRLPCIRGRLPFGAPGAKAAPI